MAPKPSVSSSGETEAVRILKSPNADLKSLLLLSRTMAKLADLHSFTLAKEEVLLCED
jgi:hypothetical protein